MQYPIALSIELNNGLRSVKKLLRSDSENVELQKIFSSLKDCLLVTGIKDISGL